MGELPNEPAGRPQQASPSAPENIQTAGWQAALQSQGLLHELRVHQIELEMQNEELTAANAEVEAGLERYVALYDFAPVAYLSVSAMGEISQLNLPAARLLGGERSSFVGSQLRNCVAQQSRCVFDAWLTKAFAGQAQESCELVLHHEGHRPPVHVVVEAALSEDGSVGRLVLIDIGSRKVLEDELRQAQTMELVGQLAGGVAHQFNNILAAMMLNLGLLRMEHPALSEADGTWQDLNELTKRASTLTTQLLSFGRRQVMRAQPVELNATLSHLSQMLERLLGEDVTCNFLAQAGELWIEADSNMLERAVLDLCLNARDAMPHGGQLTLATDRVDFEPDAVERDPKVRQGRFASLRITDTGCGMSPGVLAHAFEPFFTTKAIGQGSGLGLSSVYGAVAQHQGWVNVESVLDYGTTITLFLPLAVRQGA